MPDAVKLEPLAEELAQEDAAFEKRVSKYNRLASLWEVNARKHVWEKDDKGDVDTFAMEYGNHNGPSCEICNHSFCEHCNSFAEEEAKPCPGPTKPTKSRVHELLEILDTRTPSTTASTEGEWREDVLDLFNEVANLMACEVQTARERGKTAEGRTVTALGYALTKAQHSFPALATPTPSASTEGEE